MKNYLATQFFTFTVAVTDSISLRPSSPAPEIAWVLGKSPFFEPSFMRIWFIIKGNGHVTTHEEEFDLKEGCAYFMPSNSIVTTGLYEDMEQYYVDFIQSPDEVSIEQLYSFKKTANKEDYDLLLNLAKSLMPLYKNNDEISRMIVSSTITTMLTYFIKGSSHGYGNIQPAIDYVLNNYAKPLSVTFLANLCNYSPEYFSTKFKEILGVSPQKFIITKRLTQAKILLISTNKSIASIGKEVGYPDQMHFTKLFTNEVGISPSAYRKTEF